MSLRTTAPAALLALCCSLAACDLTTTIASPSSSDAASTGVDTRLPNVGTALDALEDIPVKGRAPRTGYSRDLFPWQDTNHNGCGTRNDILARDLTGERFDSGSDCTVVTGTLADPYSGKTIPFQRGQGTSEAVQIDHVVAISDAWQKGAQQWTADKRITFANDPLNLLAVDGPLNQQKGDGDAATWLPPNDFYRCNYVARQVAVKTEYGLWMTAAERDAIARVLSTCPHEPLPVQSDDAAEVTYANCDEVRAAGAAPIRPGDPGWSESFDGNRDGVGCE